MAEGEPWTFEQLGGPKNVITLSGWQAPHGRERKGAVIKDGVHVRKTEYTYPGRNANPTRHVFGIGYDDVTLKGRFRDRADGQGSARAKVEEFKAFVSDQQRVRVSWGNLVDFEGFIESFVPGRESFGEVEYEIKINVDVDLLNKEPIKRNVKKHKHPALTAHSIATDMGNAFKTVPRVPTTTLFEGISDLLQFPASVANSVLEFTDGLVTTVTSTFGAFRKAADSIDNVEKATVAQLNRLASCAATLQATLNTFKSTYAAVPADVAIVTQRTNEYIRHWESQASIEKSIRESCAQLADLRRDVGVLLVGRIKATYMAKQGDSWELISILFYGAPDRANDIRSANDLIPGQSPIPGNEYVIPV